MGLRVLKDRPPGSGLKARNLAMFYWVDGVKTRPSCIERHATHEWGPAPWGVLILDGNHQFTSKICLKCGLAWIRYSSLDKEIEKTSRYRQGNPDHVQEAKKMAYEGMKSEFKAKYSYDAQEENQD